MTPDTLKQNISPNIAKKSRKTVYYVIKDGSYMAYLPQGHNEERLDWDGHYRTEIEFKEKYQDYNKRPILDVE